MKATRNKLLLAVVIVMLVMFTAGIVLADVILYPGYITGTFQIGDFITKNANISATGGGYSASKSITEGDYTLTVQGGDWDYTVAASTFVGPTTAVYPRTYMVFNNRTFSVAEGQTYVNNYNFNAGIVRLKVHITGDPYNSWNSSFYATQNVSAPGERTYSQASTTSSYSPTGVWDVPVVPNDNIRLVAYVSVDGKSYSFWTTSNNLKYENIGPGEVLELDLYVNHVAKTPQPPKPPSENGRVQGEITLNLLYPGLFRSHKITGYSRDYVESNPGNYELNYELANVSRQYRAYTSFNDGNTWIYWPYFDGNRDNNEIYVYPDQTQYLDFYSDTGVLMGELKFTGSLSNDQLYSYSISLNGAENIFAPNIGWVRQVTNGGGAKVTKYGTDPDDNYLIQLTPGPWLPYQVSGTRLVFGDGYKNTSDFSIKDYMHYYDGNVYNFGWPSFIQAGGILVEDREYCMGSVKVRFRDDAGGLLSDPQINGSTNIYNDDGKKIMSVNISGNSTSKKTLMPEVELYAPTGTYNLSTLKITAEDGSRITFPAISLDFECAVRKVITTDGVPSITISHPQANLITNADSVLVVGTAADGAGISSVTVNGHPSAYVVNGNPENEVSFSYDLALSDGKNTITATVSDPLDRVSSDERDIYVDRWIPTVTIMTPEDGTVYLPGVTVPVEVQSSDRGYGFTLKVYAGGKLLCETDGEGDDTALVLVSCSGNVLSTVEDLPISAVATDLAGNSASTEMTIIGNPPPIADFVTGGGWITSPVGAYSADANVEGKAHFGFVVKYNTGSSAPSGNIEFNLNAASLKFHSTGYQWLVIDDSKAVFRGSGTINGKDGYAFLVTVNDGSPDTIRIKIWYAATGQIIYDSQRGASDNAAPVSIVKGGNIVIHDK